MAFRAFATNVDEIDAGPPEEVARENALRKALAGASEADEGDVVLGVDTVVALDTKIWGKPATQEAARTTLWHLSGRTHEVISGFAISRGGEVEVFAQTTRVTFRKLDEATIDWYIATGEWKGRAGGYAIQGAGALLVERIDGDYLNVVGLPVSALALVW